MDFFRTTFYVIKKVTGIVDYTYCFKATLPRQHWLINLFRFFKLYEVDINLVKVKI